MPVPTDHLTLGEAIVKTTEAIMSYGVDALNTPTFHSMTIAIIIWVTIVIARRA